MYFEENLAIVDTPGIGDIDQQEVAKRMMDYLPNALAFVFVINVAAAGGLQKDRVRTIRCLFFYFFFSLHHLFRLTFVQFEFLKLLLNYYMNYNGI